MFYDRVVIGDRPIIKLCTLSLLQLSFPFIFSIRKGTYAIFLLFLLFILMFNFNDTNEILSLIYIYIYIFTYIKPKPLLSPQFSTSAFFIYIIKKN